MELGTLFLEFTKSRHGEVSAWLGVSFGTVTDGARKAGTCFFNMNFMTLTATLTKSEFVVEAVNGHGACYHFQVYFFSEFSFLFYNSSKLSCCPLPNRTQLYYI